MKKYYTFYSRKTDEIVAFGTSKECCEKLGYANIDQFYASVSKNMSGKNKTYEIVVEDILEE